MKILWAGAIIMALVGYGYFCYSIGWNAGRAASITYARIKIYGK